MVALVHVLLLFVVHEIGLVETRIMDKVSSSPTDVANSQESSTKKINLLIRQSFGSSTTFPTC